eukprot:c22824_g2_i1 orf=3-2105(+)
MMMMMLVTISTPLACPLLCSAITHVFSEARVLRSPRLMAMVVMSLMMIRMPMSTSLTCPSNCSTISPLPYPFGAAPGCGSPGFQLTNCSISAPPLWNLSLDGTLHPYYIKSINSYPNVSNPKTGSVQSYGNGGTVLLYLNPSWDVPATCEMPTPDDLNAFATSDLSPFGDAELTYYQDHYFFLNCTVSPSQIPGSGDLKLNSILCNKYISYCNLPMKGSCFEYIPSQVLQLYPLLDVNKCSHLRRFLIADETAPVSTWVSLTQFAWGPVIHAEDCSSCQSSGGTCGYDTQDDSIFQCYCPDKKTHPINCDDGSAGKGNATSIAVGVSVAVIFLLVFGGVAFFYRHELYYCLVFHKERRKLDGVNEAPLDLPYRALAAATKSFSTKIGQGAFGKVYRGMLFNGQEVAVKVLDSSLPHSDEQFMNEVATIGNIHHVNVARLVGFCFRKSKRILVYEYISNGSLDQYLFPSKQFSRELVLSWKQRYDIALGIARGLCYMHEDCRSCIIHCDIKPQNILLDAEFCPKIADFGLARLLTRDKTRVMTQARGTPGYVAPEFWSFGSGPLSAKFDVYSYGMVLLEIIRGKRSFSDFNPLMEAESDDELNTWISVSVDKRIEDEADLEQAKLCTLVALWCIQDNPALRPTMSRVVQFLQGTAPVPDNPPKPFKNIFPDEDSSSQANRNSLDALLDSTQRVFSIDLSRD